MTGNSLGLLAEKSTKNQIIQVLGEQWPLSVKEIHNLLVKQHSFSGSYQAVFKALKELEESNVLEKENSKFKVSYGWVKKLSSMSKIMENNLKEKSQNEVVLLKFNSFIELGKFLINDFFTEKSAKETIPCACFWNHAYPVIGASQEEHVKMKKLFSNPEHYAICANNNYLDNLTSEYTKKLGKKSITGKKFSSKIDTFIEGNKIMQVYLPKDFEEEIELIYSLTKNEKDFDMQTLLEFGSKPREIKATIFKNKELADILLTEAKQIYKKYQKENLLEAAK
ncbi:MAG: hypothetical protein NUV57_06445 [archaeon]|nr:hypothetical protein [archaeon]